MNDVEEALRRTFARAEARIPATPPDLLRQVTEGRTRRGRRGLVPATAMATCLVIWAAAALTWRAPHPSPAVTATPAPRLHEPRIHEPRIHEPRIVEKIAPPLEQALPSVVAEVPREAPNGEAFTPKLFVDPRTMLGYVAKKGYDPAPELWIYHLESRTFRRLTVVGYPIAPVDSPAAGDGFIVWFEYVGRNIRIMAIPATGGTPLEVVTFPAELEVDEANGDTIYGVDLAVGDGRIFWSSTRSGGVNQVPVTGGKPSPVPGTKGLRLFSWPWAGRPLDGPGAMVNLLNLSTGERLDDPAQAVCHVTWCVTDSQAIRRDGSRVLDLPGDNPRSIVADRFVTLSQTDKQGRKASLIYDLATAQAGRLWMRNDRKASTTLYVSTEMIYFKRGDKWAVIHDPDR
ncbi:hypothetical protein DI270_015380 [Microbispora triticiradicis]|uniref:Uncharacterized protein n=1 Tax=Microbispora triticiradicis TaxID=2200763 RepID=A0ABX9LJI6_9ACTN|nr:hypothetical protein [Microbispora triticiradicis]RGA04095.1 hypothetical protein DI270_015380 [Microbispora triticiradicis]GLW23595.1 hypothetical protein Mame01_36380 [Microbispora amethystogenes]